MKRLAGALVLALLSSGPALADTRVQIILDMSGSMAGVAGNERKASAARKAVATALQSMPDKTHVALRLYGHRVPKDQKAEACRDSELVIPFQPIDREAILNALERAQPLGQTPIEFSLHEAAEDFGPPETSEDAVIILVSDGVETCGGDPVRLAHELVREGFKLKIFTVGFDVDEEARQQLQAVSQATGASYVDARNPASLKEAMETVTKVALGAEVVRVPVRVPYAQSTRVHEDVRAQCDPGGALAEALAQAWPSVELVDGELGRRGLTLEMQITSVRANPGGLFSGPKAISVEGTLRRGNQKLGSFEARRNSLGGPTGVFRGNCAMLDKAAHAVAEDVALWLEDPKPDSRLGELAEGGP
jgi:hypothetical protein